MPPTEVLKRLSSGFEILSSRSGDRPERQQTLRATLEWSRGLLAEEEQRLLRRLSVFEGSFSMEAAEVVGGGDGVGDVIASLTGLLDSSLVIPSDDPDRAEPRFRMLQTVQAYSREQLRESGEEELMARRHLEWFSRLCARAQPFLCGPNQRAWAARFDQERANLRAAVATGLRLGEFATVVQIAWDTSVFYEIRDANEELHSWVRQVIGRKPGLDTAMDAKLRLIDVMSRTAVGDFAGADEVLPAAREVFLAHDLALEAAVTLMVESETALRLRNDLAAAMSCLEQATNLFASVNHDWGVARIEIMRSLLYWTAGDPQTAVRCLHRSLEHSRRIDNEPQIARALTFLSMLGPDAADAEAPRLLLRDAAQIIVRGQYRTEAAACLEALAVNSHKSGRLSEANKAITLSGVIRGELGLPPPPPPVAKVMASIAGAHLPGSEIIASLRSQPDTTFSFLAETLLASPS